MGPHGDALTKDESGRHGLLRALVPADPTRVALSVCVAPVATQKTASPSAEDVERLHEQVYGRLKAVYDAQKAFAGYGDRELVVS